MSFFSVVRVEGEGHNPNTYHVQEYVGRFEGIDVLLELPGEYLSPEKATAEAARLTALQQEGGAISGRIYPIDCSRGRIYGKTLYEITKS